MKGYDFVGFGNEDEDKNKITISDAIAFSDEGSKAAEKAGLGKGADKKAARKKAAKNISEASGIISGAIDDINQKLNPMSVLRPAYENTIGKEYKGSKGGSKESSQRTSTTKDDEFKNTSSLADADIDYQKKKKEYGLA